MAFLFPKACERTSLHIASANAGPVHNLVESCDDSQLSAQLLQFPLTI